MRALATIHAENKSDRDKNLISIIVCYDIIHLKELNINLTLKLKSVRLYNIIVAIDVNNNNCLDMLCTID